MLDFLMISNRMIKGTIEIYPKFIIKTSKDLMTKGGKFYAIWLEDQGMWSKNEEDAIRLIDNLLDQYHIENKPKFEGHYVQVKYMWDADTGMIDKWHKYCEKQMWESYKSLDRRMIFADQETKKTDYASIKLPYVPDPNGSCDAYDELISTLYDDSERHKIEWCVGGVLSGDQKKMQKFAAFYGPPGTGKSTVIDILEKLFEGYCAIFKPESLASRSETFAMEQFRDNPLVALNHDSDLSRIEKNTTLNSLVSNEPMVINQKNKTQYTMRIDSFLFLGTNDPIKITNMNSGIIRRLIDIIPSGNKLPYGKYIKLVEKVKFELGAIAARCMAVYSTDKEFYRNYKPTVMMSETNDFYNFMSDSYQIFKKENGTTLKSAWELYKLYAEDANINEKFRLAKRDFSSELKKYFKEYHERIRVGNEWVRSYYEGFKTDIFESKPTPIEEKKEIAPEKKDQIIFREQRSKLDIVCANCPAQYASAAETPKKKWDEVNTTLYSIDTSKLHYLKVPDNHIVIDFDIKDEVGNKSFEKNLEEASKWPRTYAEVSKSGGGIHLHYVYNGDPSTLSRIYANHIEIKVFTGNSSLRRKLSLCSDDDIAVISSGLPIKENVGKMINFESVKNEKALRTIIKKNLNKEYHPATKPSIDFIYKVLEDAYNGGIKYDVSDLHGGILAFAASSSNQSEYCIKLVTKMRFKSEESSTALENDEQPIVFYDVEVFPNLVVVNWKFQGRGKSVTRLINPTSKDIEALMKYRLIGFNCRRYDNHILYAILVGYSVPEIYKLSVKIINEKSGFFREAYNISYTDIYDYLPAGLKMGLKKWQLKLGIIHKELGLPWNQPVPEHLWPSVAEYCDNDVISAEIVFDETQGAFTARLILAEITGMTPNDTTNTLSTKLIFGNERNPEINYVDLSREFPGYEYVKTWNEITKKFDVFNMYRGVDVGFGGYVYAEPGMYSDVGLLDIASMHPHSAINMNLFGKYTPRFKAMVDTRIAIKHGDVQAMMDIFEGRLQKYLQDESLWGSLSDALKTAINSVYGLTSASFKNPFRHPSNENNIVALRGALFMKTLQDELITRGFKVVHIKTDSIKIPNITQEAIDICHMMAKRYGYVFEHECTYDRMCLVNDAVYIAKYNSEGKKADKWTATGTQFAVPYVFKSCFSKEPLILSDFAENKEVTNSSMYLRDGDNVSFVGKVGLFTPALQEAGGKELVKLMTKKDGSVDYDFVTGTKGYYWLETATVMDILKADKYDHFVNSHKSTYDAAVDFLLKNVIDIRYYRNLVDKAIDTISKYGDYERFVAPEKYHDDTPPWHEDPYVVNGLLGGKVNMEFTQ